MNLTEKKKLVFCSLDLIESLGWENFSIRDLSKKSKLSYEKVKNYFENKNQVLVEFIKIIDKEVESQIDFEDISSSSTKDILFELIMLRLESMEKFKNALKNIFFSLNKNPKLLKILSKNISNTLDFYLELGKAYDNSLFDIPKKGIFFLIYSYVFKVWLDDVSSDNSKTMAELDKILSLAEKTSNKTKMIFPF